MIGPFEDGTPAAGYDDDHAGVSGYRTDEVLANVEGWLDSLLALPATESFVLMHIGTNDIAQNKNLDAAVANVSSIIDAIDAHDSQTTIFVALIIPYPGSTLVYERTNNYNVKLAAMLAAYDKNNLVVVDMNGKFEAAYADFAEDAAASRVPSQYYANLAHPNVDGYALMAECWTEAINAWRHSP